MARMRLHIAYEGTNYCGWQVQDDDRTVEGELRRAVTRILGADEPVKVQGASRTDSGVHAEGQVAHFDYDKKRTKWDFARGLNGLTDDDICIVRVQEAADGFHARHSAAGKVYRYRIWNHRFTHPFWRRRSWKVPVSIDVEAMAQGATSFVGEQDFAGFRSSRCGAATTKRRIDEVEISVDREPMIEITVRGNAFLHNMVRIMAGTLVEIGRGRMEPSRIDEVLESGDRCRAGITAPGRGLTLEKVLSPEYPWEGAEPELGGAYMKDTPRVG